MTIGFEDGAIAEQPSLMLSHQQRCVMSHHTAFFLPFFMNHSKNFQATTVQTFFKIHFGD